MQSGQDGGTALQIDPAGPAEDQPSDQPEPASRARRDGEIPGIDRPGPESPETDRPGRRAPLQTTRTGDATLTSDPNTNTIIVVAPPHVQRVYEQLIAILDKRRPQVMIEVILVTLDTSNNFSLGVQIGGSDTFDNGRGKVVTFSSFGLGDPETDTGSFTLSPGVGFNGIVLSPDWANVVVRALAGSGRSEVLSAPRVLVNDNATASLASIAEAPFTSINASDTVATTSFAGYASAGTTINVTPHISEGNHLQLTYSVELNSFTGEGSSTSPPPRQTNNISSEITIPNGHTVIVGGLTRRDRSSSESKVPFLGEIPILKHLVSSQSRNRNQSTLFVFLRPVILRDDDFEDLKYLSEKDLAEAKLPGNYPESTPMVMQ
jgi:general secretion pathway protein D